MFKDHIKEAPKKAYVQLPVPRQPIAKKEAKEPVLSFCSFTDTIRQMPENYLIAYYNPEQKCWVCDPCLGADKALCTKVFLELLNYESKYQSDGLQLLAKLTQSQVTTEDQEDQVLEVACDIAYMLGNSGYYFNGLSIYSVSKNWAALFLQDHKPTDEGYNDEIYLFFVSQITKMDDRIVCRD